MRWRDSVKKTNSFKALADASADKAPDVSARPAAMDQRPHFKSPSNSSQEVSEPALQHTPTGEPAGKGAAYPSRSVEFNKLARALRINRSEHLASWSHWRLRVYVLVNSRWFDINGGLLTFFSLACLVFETDIRIDPDATVPAWMDIASILTLAGFTLEISLRIFALRQKFTGFWNYMDACIVFTDWVFEVLSSTVHNNLRAAAIFRSLRLLRTFRLARAVRGMPVFRELYVMLHGFFSTLKAVVWASALLALMLLVWSVVLVEFVHPLNTQLMEAGFYGTDCDRCGRAFNGVAASSLTLVQQLVAGDSWGQVTIPLMENFPQTIPIFLCMLVTINIGLMNLILSVVVDTASEVHSQDAGFQMQQRRERMEAAGQTLSVFFRELDTEYRGEITLEQLREGWDIPDFRDTLEEMDVSKDELGALFRMMDEDASGYVSYAEFADRLVKMKMTDMSMVIVFIKSHLKQLEKSIHETLSGVQGQLDGQVSLLHELSRTDLSEIVSSTDLSKPRGDLPQASRQLQPNEEKGPHAEASDSRSQNPDAHGVLGPQIPDAHGWVSKDLEDLHKRIYSDLINLAMTLQASSYQASNELRGHAHGDGTSQQADHSQIELASTGLSRRKWLDSPPCLEPESPSAEADTDRHQPSMRLPVTPTPENPMQSRCEVGHYSRV
eukprot:TRINITY_DN19519_c0_g2_i1.p1 TRINITY_DN19519_c0_g2~~TRINITY_DN19519_c0_g2_i1.p1  ORF type:complete len:668 (+),score=102.92 TRINITY_DN19519_c0_g2_i1:85-2088(+)